jgi:hypothetical protein
VWDLWLKKWHCGRFPPPVLNPPTTPYSSIRLDTDSVVKEPKEKKKEREILIVLNMGVTTMFTLQHSLHGFGRRNVNPFVIFGSVVLSTVVFY